MSVLPIRSVLLIVSGLLLNNAGAFGQITQKFDVRMRMRDGVELSAPGVLPPHLTCIVPAASGGRWFNSRPYHGGAFLGPWALDWINLASARILQQPNAAWVDWKTVYKHRPLI